MRKSLVITFALALAAVAVIAQTTINPPKMTLTPYQDKIARDGWRTSGYKSNGVPFKDYCTNVVELKLKDDVVVTRQWREDQVRKAISDASDDVLLQVESLLGLQ